jgi:hypothetical protein
MKKSELKKLIKEEIIQISEEPNIDAKVVDGNDLVGSKIKQELNRISAQSRDNYMAMATDLRDKYPQTLKDPKIVKYINGLAQNLRDLRKLKDSLS